MGFREVRPLSATGRAFTLALILVGVGTALYAFGLLVEAVVEGGIRDLFGRRRMDKQIAVVQDHVIVCGWGRVGKAIARQVTGIGQEVVIVDRDPERTESAPHPTVVGDATDDDVLRAAGIERARAHIRDRTGALVLALRDGNGEFTTNPAPETRIEAGQVLIAVGTADQLAKLGAAVSAP